MTTPPNAPTPTIPPPTSTRSPWRGRLVALLGVALVALNARFMVSAWSPLTDLMVPELTLSAWDISLLGVAAPLCFALFGALAPALGRRYGLEALMVVALVVSGVGEFMRAGAVAPVDFIIWSLPALAGAGVANVAMPPLIKKYFPDRVGAVTALYTTCACISTALPPLTIYSLALATGWRFSLGVWALAAVAGIVPWAIVLFSRDRAGARLAAIKRRLDPRTPVERPARLRTPLTRTPVAWAIMVVFAINSLIGYTMFAWLPDMLRSVGKTDAQVSVYFSIFTLGSLLGSLVVPMITARLRRPWILPPIFFIGYIAGFGGLTGWPGQATAAWMLLTRLGDAFFPFAITMINLRTASTRGSIAMSGFVQAVGYTIAAVGPFGFGALHAATGGWHWPMVLILIALPVQMAGGLVAALSRPVDV